MKRKYLLYCALFGAAVSCKNNASDADAFKKDSLHTEALAKRNVPKETKEPVFHSLRYEELSSYLPNARGFTKSGDQSGESAHLGKSGNMYYPYAKQSYIKGKHEYYVEIIDYKDRPEILQGLIRMHGFDTIIDNKEYYTRRINIQADSTRALATIYREEQSSRLSLAVNNRFMINASVTGIQDTSSLKQLVGSIKLNELAKR